MTNRTTVRDEIGELRGNSVFKAFADQAMAQHPAAWIKESKEGHGFFKVVAEAVVEVGRGDQP